MTAKVEDTDHPRDRTTQTMTACGLGHDMDPEMRISGILPEWWDEQRYQMGTYMYPIGRISRAPAEGLIRQEQARRHHPTDIERYHSAR